MSFRKSVNGEHEVERYETKLNCFQRSIAVAHRNAEYNLLLKKLISSFQSRLRLDRYGDRNCNLGDDTCSLENRSGKLKQRELLVCSTKRGRVKWKCWLTAIEQPCCTSGETILQMKLKLCGGEFFTG